MKILLVSTVPVCKNGITNVIYNYIKAMNCEGIRFDLVANNFPDSIYKELVKSKGGKLYHIGKFPHIYVYVWKLSRLIRNNKYDIVHIHGNSHTVCVELLAAFLGGCKTRIVHAHNTYCKSLFVHKLLAFPFRMLCTHGMACGKEAGVFMFGKYDFTVMNNGVDTIKYAYDDAMRRSVRNSLQLTDDSIVVGHVGMFNEAKNHAFLVDVFDKLSKRNSNSHLVMIGDGALRNEIEHKVAGLGLNDKVTFTGNIDNVYEYLNAIDVIVMPSLHEGLPLSLIEQQANGLQCICSANITEEADKTGNLCFISLDAPVLEWVTAIEYSNCKQMREQRSKNAIIAIAKAGYSIHEEAKKLKEYYINVIER